MRYFISQPLVGNNVNGTVGEGTVSGEMALASPRNCRQVLVLQIVMADQTFIISFLDILYHLE